MQIGLGLWLGTRQVGGFSPATLFAAGEPGGWYDPSDLSTMFQDSAGTTPVTATGQTVGLMLDKSQSLALGPELVTNGDFASATGWTLGTGWSISGGVATTEAGTSGSLSTLVTVVAGRTYRVDYTITSWVSGQAIPSFAGGTAVNGPPSGTGVGTRTVFLVAATGNTTFRIIKNASADSFSIDNISIKLLAGNHLTQATAASRPIYGIEPFGGRRNLMTWTEQFDNAAWTKLSTTVTANSTVAPDGTPTADKLAEDAINNQHRANATYTFPNTNPHTLSVYAKAAERSWVRVNNGSDNLGAFFNLADGTVGTVTAGTTASITAVGDGWYRCAVTFSPLTAAAKSIAFNISTDGATTTYTGNGTSGIYLWGAQLETGSLATPYQAVTDQWNVTEEGVPSVSYVQYDGTDDWFISPTITPGIDKAQVFAGVRKLSDASIGIVAELGTGSQTGSFYMGAPRTGATANYGFNSGGTLLSDATSAASYPAPITNVLTGIADISGDNGILRVNGTQAAQSTAERGSGNYLAYPLYVGRRGGTALPFNGRLYQLLVRFGANLDASTIAATETFVNSKTGAYV